MAAPSGTTWGSIVSGEARIGLYVTTSSTNTQTTVSAQVWFWSRYSVDDSINNFYFDWDSTSASTNRGDVDINTTVSTGEGWSTANQQRIASYTKTYNRGTSASTKNCAAALSTIEVAPGTMRVNKSFSIPALASYTVSYNANGGSGAPGSQTKYYGQTLTLSSTRPTRSNYNFLGWATSATASSAQYQPGGSYTYSSNTTLYAIWNLLDDSIKLYSNLTCEAVEFIEGDSFYLQDGGIVCASEFIESSTSYKLGTIVRLGELEEV